MLQFSTGTRHQLPPQLFEQMGHYRREVFINRLGWELNTTNGMELDEFDGPDTVYVCSHDNEGSVNGVARLLPTTGPYLMEKIFPQLWAGNTLPRDPQIWELSRSTTISPTLDCSSNSAHEQVHIKMAPILIRHVFSTAKMNGAKNLITASPVSMERLLRLNAFTAQRVGLPELYQGQPIVALNFNLEQNLLSNSTLSKPLIENFPKGRNFGTFASINFKSQKQKF